MKQIADLLNIACFDGHIGEIKRLLSNRTERFPSLVASNTDDDDDASILLPPAHDLLFVFNYGSGCTPLLEVCSKSKRLSTDILMDVVKVLLDIAWNIQNSDNFLQLLLMRDAQQTGTVLHWLAMDPRDEIIKVASFLIRYFNKGSHHHSIGGGGGAMLTNAVDRRGETALDWARKYAIPVNPSDPDVSILRQRHVQRWQVLLMMFEE